MKVKTRQYLQSSQLHLLKHIPQQRYETTLSMAEQGYTIIHLGLTQNCHYLKEVVSVFMYANCLNYIICRRQLLPRQPIYRYNV